MLLCCTAAEGASSQRSFVFRRTLAAGSIGTESLSGSGDCRVVGPCLPCTATEKATVAVCDESGYRQAVECPPAPKVNLTDPRRLGDDSSEQQNSEESDGMEDRGSRGEGASKKLLQIGGGDGVTSTLQACWPEGQNEGLTVLGFETIVALVLTVAAPVMVYRRRKAGSNASTQGMQRIPSNNRF
ncbi:hypothetical protein KFL_004340130 [Klebsormidium nitens]|uniref:Uncharacterized protein n=1 Tax=Klebsormidium nitens TaxID=105231 RepID=A0A1Y1IIF8_KLENI|nr:hypothetical protein KFL_004340130 [Klebsormidium nitens]|eukprot:GAQ88506.1 hypothetical protein KFL_004340130 [Klebsormidium nitens]